MIHDFIFQYWQNLLIVIAVFTIGVASPGPATLMILNVAVSKGRRQAIALSVGVVTGSTIWAAVTALGFGAAIKTSVTIFVVLKFAGACYLLYLAAKSLRCAMSLQPVDGHAKGSVDSSVWRSYLQGLTLHLINPKAALVWLATLSVGMEASVHPLFFFVVISLCSLIAVVVYTGYAIVFSTGMISRGYMTMRRPLDLFCGVLFGAAAIKMLTLSVL